jgi:multidrug resistance protein
MTSTPALPAGKRPLLAVFLVVLIDLLGFGIVIPLLPVYSKAYGASETTMGLLFATFSAMQFLFAPMWGRLSDRIGRRPVLVGGLFGTAASYVLFALSDSLWMLFLSRALAGFLAANISTAMAYVADVTTPENRAKGMGLIGAAFGIGFTLGPLMGGELTHISPAAPGWAAAGFSLLAALYAWSQLVEPPRERRQSRVFSLEQVRGALRDGRVGTPYLLSYLFIVAFASFESMFTAFGLARFPDVFGLSVPVEEATQEQIIAAAPITGRYLAGIGVVSALIQGGLIRRLVPKYGETKLAVVGPWFLAAGFVVVALAQDWTMVVLGCLLMPIGFGLNNPSVNSLISRAAPSDQQGAYLGLSQSIGSLARMVGPLAAGVAFTTHGPAAPFWLGALLLVASGAIALLYHRRHGASFPKKAAGH